MSTTDDNIEAIKKMILDNREITIREVANDVRLMPRNFYGCFRHETCGSEDYSKLLNFVQKQLRMDIAQEILTPTRIYSKSS